MTGHGAADGSGDVAKVGKLRRSTSGRDDLEVLHGPEAAFGDVR